MLTHPAEISTSKANAEAICDCCGWETTDCNCNELVGHCHECGIALYGRDGAGYRFTNGEKRFICDACGMAEIEAEEAYINGCDGEEYAPIYGSYQHVQEMNRQYGLTE